MAEDLPEPMMTQGWAQKTVGIDKLHICIFRYTSIRVNESKAITINYAMN